MLHVSIILLQVDIKNAYFHNCIAFELDLDDILKQFIYFFQKTTFGKRLKLITSQINLVYAGHLNICLVRFEMFITHPTFLFLLLVYKHLTYQQYFHEKLDI